MSVSTRWRSHALSSCIVILALLLFSTSTSEAFPYKGYDISMSASLSQVYDSNINFNDDDDDSKTDGYRVNGGVDLSLRRSLRRGYFDMTGGFRRGFYYNLGDVESESASLAISFSHDFSQSLRIKMVNNYYYSTEPYSFGEEFFRETGRYDLHRNTFQFSLFKDVTKDFFLDTSYSHTNIWRDERSLEEDYSSDTFRLGLNYRQGADKTYYLSYSISESNHEDSDDTTYHQIRAGIKKFLTLRTNISGYVGFSFEDSDTGLEDASNSFSVSLNHMINRTTTAGLDIYWGNFLFNEDDVFSENWRISGRLDRNISEKTAGSVNVFYGEYDTDEHGGTNEFLGIGGTFNYQYSRHFNVNLGLSYSRSRQEDGVGYSRKSASLGVTYSY